MSGLSYLTLNTKERTPYINISFDEGINAILFDYGMRVNVFSGFPAADHFFGNNQVQKITCLEDAVQYGLEEGGFMGGIPYYHIKRYYKFIGKSKELYVMFASCTTMVDGVFSPDFSVIPQIQMAANGDVFQIGIWTEQQVWKLNEDGKYGFTQLLGEIEAQAENLSGKIGIIRDNESGASVILCANTASLYDGGSENGVVDYKKLPYALSLNYSNITLLLGQNGTDDVHDMQRNNVRNCPVGILGDVLGCLTIASAEESIGCLKTMDLNKNDDFNNVELGFGRVTGNPETDYFTPIEDINNVRRNVISQSGYVFPTTYKPREASYFLTNDQTLSIGDYSKLTNNRVIHKCQRIIRSVMLPYIEENVNIDQFTGRMHSADIAILKNEITQALGEHLVNTDGQQQTNGCYIDINPNVNILQTDSIEIDVSLFPADASPVINFQEQYQI